MSLCGVQTALSSTPPSLVPTPARSSGKRGSTLVSFRSGLSEHELGSLKSGPSRSLTPEGSAGILSLSRSQGGRSRTTTGEGSALAASSGAVAFSPLASTSGSNYVARPLQSTVSIPKSAAFVKIEGFDTKDSSPAGSAPASPQQPRVLSNCSLLSRQLSTDRLPVLGSPIAGSLAASSGSGAGAPPVGLDDPLLGLEARLESSAVRVAPVPRPAPLPRTRSSIPDNLLQQLQSVHSVFQEPVCVRAFGIARAAHDGKYRASGEPAFMHCVEVARILAELGADQATVSAALLHDVLDCTLLLEAQLRPMLADDGVADLVKKVVHLGDVSSKYRACPATSLEGQAELSSQLVGMLVAMGCNHALLVKLADRLHDMRTLGALPAAKRNRLARETIDVWAPLANRLGVWSLKAQLEDLAFKHLYPVQYAELRERLEQVQSATMLVSLVDRLRAELQQQGIDYHDLSGRPKHLWGVFKKMSAKGVGLGRISDVRGLRIVVETKAECYQVLRAVERIWKPVGPTKDYIRSPKENGYRSLHTVVQGEDGHYIEVQIRTAKMHFFAEYGAEAAHWQYKERNYGSTGAATAASSTDDDIPASAPGRGAAREANWAKFQLSQQVNDQKYRPSGSPSQDHSLASIVGAAATAAAFSVEASSGAASSGSSSCGEESPSCSPPRDERFAAYLERSGQALEPPPAERVVVAVVRQGGLTIQELPQGTSLSGLVQQQGLGVRDIHNDKVLVNKQVESNPAALLRTGDIVDLYGEPASERAAPAPRAPATGSAVSPLLAPRQGGRVPVVLAADNGALNKAPLSAGRSNVVPLGALKTARLRSADAS